MMRLGSGCGRSAMRPQYWDIPDKASELNSGNTMSSSNMDAIFIK